MFMGHSHDFNKTPMIQSLYLVGSSYGQSITSACEEGIKRLSLFVKLNCMYYSYD